MRARLKATAQRWKNTALKSTKRHRLQLAQLNRCQRRIMELEAELAELKFSTSPVSIKNHTYPAQLIALAVFMVVHGKSSLRCAAKTVGFVAQLLGWAYREPSHTTVRRWVLRCGLWQLNYSTDKAGNYVAILDESIQIGREKLLLLLGVKRQYDRSIAAPLTSQDVEVLGLEVQQSWTGDNIADFMHRQLNRLPLVKLSYVISDSGTNLRKAFRIIGVDQVGDCSHVMMNAVKKSLQNNKVLSELIAKVGQLRSKLMQTSEGYLLPSTFRDKDRFLHIFAIVKWVERIDAYWAKLPQSSRDKLSFIEQARPLIKCIVQLKALIEITAAVLKFAGLSSTSEHKWEQRISDYTDKHNLTAESQAFIETVRKYFKKHVDLVAQHGRLICCSDIIESTFGRYKNKGGTPVISADVLSISLYNMNITTDLVCKALTSLPYKEVHQWEQDCTCDNRYSIVRRMNRELKSVV